MASNAYFAYVFVGAWLGTEKKLTPEDMGLVMTDVLKRVRFFFSMTDMNRTPEKWYRDMKKTRNGTMPETAKSTPQPGKSISMRAFTGTAASITFPLARFAAI